MAKNLMFMELLGTYELSLRLLTLKDNFGVLRVFYKFWIFIYKALKIKHTDLIQKFTRQIY